MKTENKQLIVRSVVRFSLLVQLLMAGIALARAQESAEAVLEKAAKTYEEASGIEARFSVRARSPQLPSGESFEGLIHMKGEKFKLQIPGMIVWYDGETQWTYMERTEEVNVSTPTGDELRFTNPIILLHSYQKGFDVSLKGSSTTRQGKSAYDVELTAKKKGDILSVDLQIEKDTGFPASMDVKMKDDMRNTVVISQWETSKNQPDSFFVFNGDEFPDAEVVDLR